MNRTSLAAISWFLLSASSALAALPAPTPYGGGVALKSGDTVEFELTGLPISLEGAGLATCVGTQNTGTGPAAAKCDRPFDFELPAEDTHIAVTFRGANGRATPIELPVVRSRRPVTFVAPSDGSLVPPGLPRFSQEAIDAAAQRVAERKCGECKGSGFTLESFKVTRSPVPSAGSLPVKFKVTPRAAPAAR